MMPPKKAQSKKAVEKEEGGIAMSTKAGKQDKGLGEGQESLPSRFFSHFRFLSRGLGHLCEH